MPGTVVEGSGTSTCLTRSVAKSECFDDHVLPNSSLRIHMLSSTGASFRWLNGMFAPEGLYEVQTRLLSAKPVATLFLPYLRGERSPLFDERATGTFFGLRPDTGKEELLLSLFHGVAFAIRQNLSLMGEGIQRIRAVGGCSQSEPWLQIKADITGLPVEKMAEQDASALGAALVAAYGSGLYDRAKLSSFVPVEKTFYPNPAYAAEYDALYALYTGLYEASKEIAHGLFYLQQKLA